MEIDILNLYNNTPPTDSKLKGDHGESFLISTPEAKILMDVGAKGKILLENMKQLGITPDEVTHLIFTHGHYDHTAGLPEFLNARVKKDPLPVYAHPDIHEEKVIKLGFLKKYILN